MDSQSQSQSILKIPKEILEQIFIFLDQYSLHSIVQTYHKFHDVGVPLLWRHIRYSSTAQYKSLRDELIRNPEKGHLIQSIHVDSPDLFSRCQDVTWGYNFLSACPNLEDLALCGQPERSDGDDSNGSFLTLVERLSDFREVLMRNLELSLPSRLRSCYLSFPIFSPNLSSEWTFWDPYSVSVLFAHPTLQDLTIDTANFGNNFKTILSSEMFTLRRGITPLRRLCLKHSIIDHETLELILNMPKELEQFNLFEHDDEPDYSIRPAAIRIEPRAEGLNPLLSAIVKTEANSLQELHLISNSIISHPIAQLSSLSKLRHVAINLYMCVPAMDDPRDLGRLLPQSIEVLEIIRSCVGLQYFIIPLVLTKHALLPSLKMLILTEVPPPEKPFFEIERLPLACQRGGVELVFKKSKRKMGTHPWDDDRRVEVSLTIAEESKLAFEEVLHRRGPYAWT